MSPCRSDFIFTNLIVGVWREVSEDSDQVSAGLAVIHCLGDLGDFHHTVYGEMSISLHQFQTFDELTEV